MSPKYGPTNQRPPSHSENQTLLQPRTNTIVLVLVPVPSSVLDASFRSLFALFHPFIPLLRLSRSALSDDGPHPYKGPDRQSSAICFGIEYGVANNRSLVLVVQGIEKQKPSSPAQCMDHLSEADAPRTSPESRKQKTPSVAELSKKISVMWKTETAESRGKFEHLANLSKTQHQLDFPDYQFRPQKRADKEKERAEKKKEKDRERAEQRLAKLNKRVQSSSSTSAPTPHSIVDGHSSTPAPSTSQLPPAASTSSTQLQNVHSHMVDRYGVCGPSPPLSQAPSPYGSPAMEASRSTNRRALLYRN